MLKKQPYQIPEGSSVVMLDAIDKCLKTARKYDLEAEVVWSSLNYLKENSKKDIVDALAFGIGEWIK